MIITGTGNYLEDGLSSNAEIIWGDIETQRFYCELPELQAFLPTSLIQKNQVQTPVETVTEEVLDKDIPAEDLEDDGKLSKDLILYFSI